MVCPRCGAKSGQRMCSRDPPKLMCDYCGKVYSSRDVLKVRGLPWINLEEEEKEGEESFG